MNEFSPGMKKVLCVCLDRISTTQVRVLVGKQDYLKVLAEIKQLQQTLENELIGEMESDASTSL